MYSFTFRQIEIFLEICRVGNFSGAAGKLDVSQPAVSNAIRSLESQLGVELFERRRGASCVLTPAGITFREIAQQFIARCEAIGQGARRGKRRPRPLRVYIGAHLLDDYIRPELPEFYEENPQLQMNFLPEKSRNQIVHDIQTGRIDVAVITVAPDERPPGSVLIGTVPAGIYGVKPPRGEITAAAISMLPFVLPAAGSQLTTSMLRHLESAGVRPKQISYCPYHDVRVRMACRGKGMLFAAQSVVDKHDVRKQLRLLLPTEPWERRLYINPRVEPTSATAIATFVARALNSATGE
jgi:LysR family transcriptional regulator, low CO2-responsive transcriptional regulator